MSGELAERSPFAERSRAAIFGWILDDSSGGSGISVQETQLELSGKKHSQSNRTKLPMVVANFADSTS